MEEINTIIELEKNLTRSKMYEKLKKRILIINVTKRVISDLCKTIAKNELVIVKILQNLKREVGEETKWKDAAENK